MAALIDTYGMPPMDLLTQYAGACRYVSHEADKTLTAAQVAAIHGANRSVVLNFEDSATNAQGGQPKGVQDAQFFVAQVQALGAPRGVAGYASVDYEVHNGQALATALDYFRGWTPVLHAAGYLSGAYGDADLIAALFDAKLIDLGWQTVAWSYGTRDSRACLLQDQFNGSHDVDEIDGFYGGWLPTGPQPNPMEDIVTPQDIQAVVSAIFGHQWSRGGLGPANLEVFVADGAKAAENTSTQLAALTAKVDALTNEVAALKAGGGQVDPVALAEAVAAHIQLATK